MMNLARLLPFVAVVVAALLAPLRASAQEVDPRVDRSLNSVRSALGAQQKCLADQKYYVQDVEETRARLNREFKTIPETFAPLIEMKRARAGKFDKLCAEPGALVNEALKQAGEVIGSIDPPSMAWLPAKRRELAALFAKAKAVARPPNPKPAK